ATLPGGNVAETGGVDPKGNRRAGARRAIQYQLCQKDTPSRIPGGRSEDSHSRNPHTPAFGFYSRLTRGHPSAAGLGDAAAAAPDLSGVWHETGTRTRVP